MTQFIDDLLLRIQSYYSDLVEILPNVILAVITFTIIFLLANRSRNYVGRQLTARMDDPLLARFIARIVKITGIIFGLLIVLKIVGLTDIATGILTGASVSAIVIGFAFKDIGENFLAGIMLAFNRPFRVGDIVELDSRTGKVVSLNLRTTQIKTFDGKDIYIPNAIIIKTSVVNNTIDGFQRYNFDIGLDYGSDVNRAIQITLDVLKSIPGILNKDKEPSVFLTTLGESTMNLTAYYWLDTFDKNVSSSQVKTEAMNKTLTELTAKGFNLPGNILELKNYHTDTIQMQVKQSHG